MPTSSARPLTLITGATSGIGLELARLFARDGYPLILTARSESRLRAAAEEIGARDALLISGDLAKINGAERLVDQLAARKLSPGILVNNAGFGDYGAFVECDPLRTRSMLLLNVMALTTLTRLLLPDMIERGGGRILNVASTAAFAPGPLMASYYASKAYVVSFSAALAEELRGTGVTVTTLCPGPTRTGFQDAAGVQFAKSVSGLVMDAAPVAEAGYRGVLAGKRMVIPGMKNRLSVAAAALTPLALAARLVHRMQLGKNRGSSAPSSPAPERHGHEESSGAFRLHDPDR